MEVRHDTYCGLNCGVALYNAVAEEKDLEE